MFFKASSWGALTVWDTSDGALSGRHTGLRVAGKKSDTPGDLGLEQKATVEICHSEPILLRLWWIPLG